ncbi:MAG: 23S rRNA (uracil(1939)-C(5))-methyltransferase RlmD [Planctomycetes bacterium]|nr:23S rRNA (uracil(1939)-C(5))-methyltransferase RlmD [Planctomycetota bacterium]
MDPDTKYHQIRKCPYFGECGGCDFLNQTYERQLDWKHRRVAEAFAEYKEFAGVRVSPAIAAPSPWDYRHRLLYPLARRGGKVIGGFFKKSSHDLVDVATCEIQDPAITELAEKIKLIIQELEIPIHPLPGVESDSVPEAGGAKRAGLRALALRRIPNRNAAFVGFVTTGGLFPEAGRLAERAQAAAKNLKRIRKLEIAGVIRNINETETNVIFGPKSVPLSGKDAVQTRIGKFEFSMDLTSFFQPNPAAAQRAAETIFKNAPPGIEFAVDAYAGAGFFSLYLAQIAASVAAIEEAPASQRAAARNIKLNDARNITFHGGSVENELGKRAGGKIDLLFMDPPRSGLTPDANAAVLRAKPELIYYLSCNETSLARDLAGFASAYRVAEIQPFDFLPQTEHVEVFARLIRKT